MRSYGTIVSALWPYFFNLDRRPREGIPSAVYGGVNGGATGLRTSVAASDPTEVLCAKYEAACLGRAGLLPNELLAPRRSPRDSNQSVFLVMRSPPDASKRPQVTCLRASERIPGPRHETLYFFKLLITPLGPRRRRRESAPAVQEEKASSNAAACGKAK